MTIFALIFALVSVANAKSMCDKAKSRWIGIPRVATYMAESVIGKNYGNDYEGKAKYYENVLIRYYDKAFNINHKESICAYMMTFDTAFLGTNLTAQDIESYERFLTKKGEYSAYKADKYHYLMVLKFLKYHNIREQFYNVGNNLPISSFISGLENLMAERKYMKFVRFVYGENAGYLDFNGNNIDTLKLLTQGNNCANRASTRERLEFCKVLKSIVQWAESNMK